MRGPWLDDAPVSDIKEKARGMWREMSIRMGRHVAVEHTMADAVMVHPEVQIERVPGVGDECEELPPDEFL